MTGPEGQIQRPSDSAKDNKLQIICCMLRAAISGPSAFGP